MTENEKRLAIRVPSSRPVIVVVGEKNSYGTMTDFSEHGIGFMSALQVSKDERIEVHFDIPNQDGTVHPFQFKAYVKHCMPISHESHIGVQLDFPTQEYLNTFKQVALA